MSTHSNDQHIPVLKHRVLDYLNVQPDGLYLDATFGRGGHSQAILSALGPQGRLFACDQDPQAEAKALDITDERFQFKRLPFSALGQWLSTLDVDGIDGLLADVGLSSPQLDNPERGFSFQNSGPLDMRMDPTRGLSAAQWLATVRYDDLVWVLRTYGEERYASRIAKAIDQTRRRTSINTTQTLAELVKRAVPRWPKTIHPATRTFQALRIYVNDELGQLQALMDQASDWLRPNGRLMVLSFHSLEDRIVKHALRYEARERKRLHLLTPKPLRATSQEIRDNPRARSVRLRAAKRL